MVVTTGKVELLNTVETEADVVTMLVIVALVRVSRRGIRLSRRLSRKTGRDSTVIVRSDWCTT